MFGLGKKKRENSKINWQILEDKDQISFMVKQSVEKPVVLFKHSPNCSISNTALHRFEKNYDRKMDDKAFFYLLDVIKHRDVSKLISEQFGVIHESPQMLLIQAGICTFNESHFGIKFEDVVTQLVGN